MRGRPMRQYVRLPEELLADPRKRANWIKRSLHMPKRSFPKPKRRRANFP
jgi:TfoX/Sxy family transcriptional regulator of competence genes